MRELFVFKLIFFYKKNKNEKYYILRAPLGRVSLKIIVYHTNNDYVAHSERNIKK